jgi:uncharacterized protein (DUF1501 family)
MTDDTRIETASDGRRALMLGMAGLGLLAMAGKARAASTRDTLVVIFQRGGADGLNMVVPFGDSNYFTLRGTQAIPAPDQAGGVLSLDGYFGLHPSLAALVPIYRAGQMAVVHAAGLPVASRSHFRAQLLLEFAVNNLNASSSGWLARFMASTASAADSPLRAISVGTGMPISLAGAASAAAVQDPAVISIPNRSGPGFMQALGEIYNGDDWTSLGARQALSLVDSLARSNPAQFTPANGASYPGGALGAALKQTAQFIKAGLGAEIFCVESGGWDTHSSQAPRLSLELSFLGNAIAAFCTDMGARMSDITILVMSEFGRTPKFNASAGTDHGAASCMLAVGGGVKGGVYSDWPGLAASQLDSEGDLRATLDSRAVLGDLVASRLGGADLAQVFPDFTGGTLGLFHPR